MKPAASYCCVTVGCVSHTPAFVSAIIVDAVPTDPTRSNSTHTHTLKPGAARCIRFFLFFFLVHTAAHVDLGDLASDRRTKKDRVRARGVRRGAIFASGKKVDGTERWPLLGKTRTQVRDADGRTGGKG